MVYRHCEPNIDLVSGEKSPSLPVPLKHLYWRMPCFVYSVPLNLEYAFKYVQRTYRPSIGRKHNRYNF